MRKSESLKSIRQNKRLCVPAPYVFFLESDFLTSCYYTPRKYFIREDAKKKNEKIFSDHTRNFHTAYSFLGSAAFVSGVKERNKT